MVKLTRADTPDVFLISGYGDTTFRVAGKQQEGAVIVTRSKAEAFTPSTFADVTAPDITASLEAMDDIELLLIGCGKSNRPLKKAIRDGLAPLALDTMDTGAAARTYNVLVMEDRRVGVLLFPAGT